MNLSRAIFQPFPSEVIFQQYEPGKLYEVPLQLRNDDKVPRLIKVSVDFSPYFKVVAPANSGEKIAPGMAAQYTVQFFPEENKVRESASDFSFQQFASKFDVVVFWFLIHMTDFFFRFIPSFCHDFYNFTSPQLKCFYFFERRRG